MADDAKIAWLTHKLDDEEAPLAQFAAKFLCFFGEKICIELQKDKCLKLYRQYANVAKRKDLTQWAGVSYSHSTHVQLNPAGNASFPISHRHKSVKSLMSIFRNSGHINDVNNKSVTKRLAQHMQSYHYKIGGVQYPEYPVEVGVGQGKLAPAATQLELVFGKLGDRVNSNCIDRYNFSPDLDQWQRAGCNNVVSKMIYSVELETYGSNSSLLESGISTDSGSPNMMFSCNLGNNVTGNMRIDTYAMYDCIFSILPDQSLSVQH